MSLHVLHSKLWKSEIPFTPDNDSTPVVVDYVDDNSVPAYIEGSTVSFSCLPGFELIEPNSATCTENGEWIPEPTGIMCNNMSLEGEHTIMHKSVLWPTPTPTCNNSIVMHFHNYHTESATGVFDLHVPLGCKRKSVCWEYCCLHIHT